MYTKRHFYTISVLLALFGCTKTVDFPYPETPQFVTLNGFLYPDSTIHVNLSWATSLKRENQTFPPVEHAIISLYEDGQLLDELTHTTEGNYSLDYYPQAGKTYKIEAMVPEYGLVTATDVMPQFPDVTVCYAEDESILYSDVMIHINVDDSAEEDNYYWLNFLQRLYDEEIRGWEDDDLVFYPNSNTVFLDRFNAQFDNTGSKMYQFNHYIRFDDLGHEGKSIKIVATSSDTAFRKHHLKEKQNLLFINFFNASYHYDRYIKSSIIHFLNNDFLDISPFAEPTKIYSNVENGTGIFAACNNVQLLVNQQECK